MTIAVDMGRKATKTKTIISNIILSLLLHALKQIEKYFLKFLTLLLSFQPFYKIINAFNCTITRICFKTDITDDRETTGLDKLKFSV